MLVGVGLFVAGTLVGGSASALVFLLTTRRLLEERASLRSWRELSDRLGEGAASRQDISELIAPIKHDLAHFRQRVDGVFLDTAREQLSLKEEIKRVAAVNQAMTTQTENLTKALKGDVRTQGVWGEIVLERLLESSGLRKGQEYIVQGSEMRLKDAERGGSVKPDVVIKLPDDRHIVIDSKVSLTAYERLYQSECSDSSAREHIRSFVSSIRAHVHNLASKEYSGAEGLNSPDFVFMFMPIDGAYALAMRHEPGLHEMAWQKGIVIVAPATLLATLRTVSLFWRGERQNNNAVEIARRGGMLYDKVVRLIESVEEIGAHLGRATRTYDTLVHRLSRERGNIVFQIQQLKDLGAKTSQSVDARWIVHNGTDPN